MMCTCGTQLKIMVGQWGIYRYCPDCNNRYPVPQITSSSNGQGVKA
ncbi:hypothetical protein [Methanosarcina acetivorans]|nr:hypothetical protein [Methanosarcina acetivorans]